MARFDPGVFLDKLTAYLAANAVGGALEYAGTPRAVWRGEAVERDAAPVYSTVIPYGGSVGWVPVARNAVQVMTFAASPTAAHQRASALFGALHDVNGRPLRMIDLGGGYRLLGVNAQVPQMLPVDDAGATVVFNFDASAVAV